MKRQSLALDLLTGVTIVGVVALALTNMHWTLAIVALWVCSIIGAAARGTIHHDG